MQNSPQIITPKKALSSFSLLDLYNNRELISILAFREFKVKYVKTSLGWIWVVLNPLISLLILTFIFSKVARIENGNVPYIILTLTGLIGWSFFAEVTSSCSEVLLQNQHIIKKVYFPRLVFPISKVIVSFIDFVVLLLLFLFFLFYYDFELTYKLIWFPLIWLGFLCLTIGCAIIVSALVIRFRDFKFITPFLIRIGYLISPIAFPIAAVPEKYERLILLNPIAGYINAIRWSVLDYPLKWEGLLFSIFCSIGAILLGLLIFSKTEKVIADIF